MSAVIDFVRSLGAGQSVVMGVTALLVAWYVFKAVKIGKFVGSLFTSAAGYGIVLLVAGGGVIALGWVDPNIPKASEQVAAASGWLWDLVGAWVVERLSGAL